MAQFFTVHPDNPQARLLKQAVQLLNQGSVLAVPTDSSYALVCHLDDKNAADQLRRIRGVDDKHHLTVLCRDLSELANYARVDNQQFRAIKQATPGPFTFILEATKEVPRRVSHPQRKSLKPLAAPLPKPGNALNTFPRTRTKSAVSNRALPPSITCSRAFKNQTSSFWQRVRRWERPPLRLTWRATLRL